MTVYETLVPDYDSAKGILLASGRNPPKLKQFQFWYDDSGRLLIILGIMRIGRNAPNNGLQSKYPIVTVVFVESKQIKEIHGREFKRFCYAPMILNKIL